MKTRCILAGLVLSAQGWLAPAAAADKAAEKPRQWEHLALTHELKGGQSNAEVAREIIRLGREGWELVSVANFQENGTTTKTAYYFKRPLARERDER
mgnify:CR=1 FL=1